MTYKLNAFVPYIAIKVLEVRSPSPAGLSIVSSFFDGLPTGKHRALGGHTPTLVPETHDCACDACDVPTGLD